MLDKQTSLYLNGPILSFVENPIGFTTSPNSQASFAGFSTAFFPDNNNVPDGSIQYRWYEVGVGPLTDSSTIVGSATTSLTVSNLKTPQDNNRRFYLEASYTPSAYSQPVGSAVTVGTGRSTGNAINEPLSSNVGTLTVLPEIIITSQPKSLIVGSGGQANFSVEAELSDPSFGTLSYQWKIDDQNVNDGNFETNANNTIESFSVLSVPFWNGGYGNVVEYIDKSANPKTLTISGNTSWNTSVKKFYDGSAFFDGSSFFSISPTNDFAFGTGDFTIESWVYFTATGFKDIFSTGIYGQNQLSFRKNAYSQLIQISPGSEQLEIYYNATIIASGGTFQLNRWYHVAVTRQSGIVRLFIDGNVVAVNSSFNGNIQANAPRIGSVSGNGFPMSGYIQDLKVYKGVAKYTDTFIVPDKSILSNENSFISVVGSNTNSLTLFPQTIGSNNIKVSISNPFAITVDSNNALLSVTSPRQILSVEGYGSTSTASLLNFDLKDGNYSIDSSVVDSDTICLYASEKDLEVEVDLYAANGVNVGSFVGGEGGYSKVRFSMKKNEEFIIKGIKSNSGLFLYRKGSLIAVVGQGGNAGTSGNGGPGGGVNVAGGNGSGRSSGSGGLLTSSGQLTTSGIFGSLSNVSTSSILSGDSKATGTLGGRTISCPKGNYWISQGKSPCEDVGNVKFRLSNGTEVSNSAIITRGFKDNYSINATAGRGIDNGGNGGSGATGGSGGVGSGGGGGSGYTNDFVNIITAGLGGNTGRTRINIKSTVGNFFVDSFGRILILSSVTVGKDPRTLTKTTDRVLPNTDTCIDDARWQNFIELARTQNYRLTATLNNSTIRITNATDNNIRRMINGNNITLKNSLTAWEDTGYIYQLLALAWDETDASGARGFGVDYSILSWSPASVYGFGYYGDSRNPFFVGSTYSQFTANWWILPPGVPDF
jgi:hypothetical protein